jgi:hypothetical protein
VLLCLSSLRNNPRQRLIASADSTRRRTMGGYARHAFPQILPTDQALVRLHQALIEITRWYNDDEQLDRVFFATEDLVFGQRPKILYRDDQRRP